VSQKPLELILARNLMSALSTPAFLVDEGGLLVFFNEAAGTLLGKGFDEVGHVGPREWGGLFGPYDAAGETIPYEELPVVRAVRAGRPAHASFGVRAFDGRVHAVECSAFPILTAHGSQGAIAIFWPVEEGLPTEAVAAAAGATGTDASVNTSGAAA
jgi:PAS domain-containing protein